MNLTAEQIEAVKRGEVVRLSSPEVGDEVVMMRAERYEKMRVVLEDQKLQES